MPSPLEQFISALDQFNNVELGYIRSVAASHIERMKPQTSPIFKLPQELRDEIYHLLASAFFSLHTSDDASFQDYSLTIVRVNEQIHAEFLNVFYGSTYFRGFFIDELANGQQLSAAIPPKLIQKIIEHRRRNVPDYLSVRDVLMATFNSEKEQVLREVRRSTVPGEANTQQTEVSCGQFLRTMVKRKGERSQPVHVYIELLSMPERCRYFELKWSSQNSTLEGDML